MYMYILVGAEELHRFQSIFKMNWTNLEGQNGGLYSLSKKIVYVFLGALLPPAGRVKASHARKEIVLPWSCCNSNFLMMFSNEVFAVLRIDFDSTKHNKSCYIRLATIYNWCTFWALLICVAFSRHDGTVSQLILYNIVILTWIKYLIGTYCLNARFYNMQWMTKGSRHKSTVSLIGLVNSELSPFWLSVESNFHSARL